MKFHAPVKNKFIKRGFKKKKRKKRAFVVCIEEACTAQDHIWMMGPMRVNGCYVKPRADRDQQTGPSAHVGICHTYLTTCVICGGGEKSVTSPTALSLNVSYIVPYLAYLVIH